MCTRQNVDSIPNGPGNQSQLSQVIDHNSKLSLRLGLYNCMFHATLEFHTYRLRNGRVISFVDFRNLRGCQQRYY